MADPLLGKATEVDFVLFVGRQFSLFLKGLLLTAEMLHRFLSFLIAFRIRLQAGSDRLTKRSVVGSKSCNPGLWPLMLHPKNFAISL